MSKKREHTPIVLSRHGRYRFLRGMATASMLQRGLSMEEAFDASRVLRNLIAGRETITADELEAEIAGLLESSYGIARPHEETPEPAITELPSVTTGAGEVPLSLDLLVRPLLATGLGVDEAIALAHSVQERLGASPIESLTEARVEDEVAWLLGEHHAAAYARRYRLTCWVRRAEQPLLILIGGAAGTGKSTVATELAYRLGVRKVTSTDIVRETMRTVLPAEVIPGLHDHSFRGILQGGQVLSDPRERVLAGFRQQAHQVEVGIRAVIRRTLKERSHMILEGVHLMPPFAQLLPPDAPLFAAGVILALPVEKKHRRRFIRRAAREPERLPSAYLDAFQSVRWIHDDLLHMVDEHDALVLDNTRDLKRTLNDLMEYVARVVPIDAPATARPFDIGEREVTPDIETKTLLLLLDGLADEPCDELDGLTPLAAAHTPTLDLLAGAGGQGQLDTTSSSGRPPSTASAMLRLLGGLTDGTSVGRGVIEALGRGLTTHQDAIYLRGNLATVAPDGRIIDRRAGRIRDGVDQLLRPLQHVELPGHITGSVTAALEHRVVVTLRGPGLSPAIANTDPGDGVDDPHVQPVGVREDSADAARTAEALAQLLQLARTHLEGHPLNEDREARGLLPANAVITRGAGSPAALHRLVQLRRPGTVVASCPTTRGVGRAIGMETVTTARMTGNLDTDLDEKLREATRALEDRELVVVHIKGTDIAAHDRHPEAKRDFITDIDAALGRFLVDGGAPEGLRVVVTADHGTSSRTGHHLADPVPLLLARWDPEAEPAEFDESTCREGALGLLPANELADLLWGAMAGSPAAAQP